MAQTNWRWCQKCQGLWFADNNVPGVCPAGGGHSQLDSGDYVLAFAGWAGLSSSGQTHWRWCQKRQGLWFDGALQSTDGVCPAWQETLGDQPHNSAGSGDYALTQV
jgi:hypothetical protein